MNTDICTPFLIRKGTKTCYPLCMCYYDSNIERFISPIWCCENCDIDNTAEKHCTFCYYGYYSENLSFCILPIGIYYQNYLNSYYISPCLICMKNDPQNTHICSPTFYGHVKTVENYEYWRIISIIGCFNNIPSPPDIFPQVEGPKKQFMEDICVICKDSSSSIGLSPCGHLCICERCIKHEQFIQKKRCPICSANITGIYEIEDTQKNYLNWLP